MISANIPAWTEQQRDIIQASPGDRIVVEAGPGTGKTAVACARVAWLADQGVNPSAIMMLSFTRTAVSEIRNRIKGWSSTPGVTAARITTIDSMAWYFRYGTGEDFGNLTGSFDENIEQCIELLKTGSPVLNEYLDDTAHLIIDESQDLTGLRSELIAELIKRVPESCGITVFADPVQAIYGFTTDVDDDSSNRGTLLDTFPFEEEGFQQRRLDKIHRTESPKIVSLFMATRKAATLTTSSPADLPREVLRAVKLFSDDLDCDVKESDVDDGDLVLSRRRAQSLHLAAWHPELCRLRLSGLSTPIHPWIGAVFHKYPESSVSRQTFDTLWDDTVKQIVYDSISRDQAWELLQQHARGRRGLVDLTRLRRVLVRSRPHIHFCLPDFGMWGPIFGTIHASKGREADRVVLTLPWKEDRVVRDEDDPDSERANAEEARVYYVGATRARKYFEHAKAPSLIGATALESGRVWHSYEREGGGHKPKPKAKVQFGMTGDVDLPAIVRRDFCASASAANAAHRELVRVYCDYINGDNTPAPLKATLKEVTHSGEKEWRHVLELDDEDYDCSTPVGWFHPRVATDLWAAANAVQERLGCYPLKPPSTIRHLRMIGLCTVAVEPDSREADMLHEPFSSSGFLLAPMVFGFPQVFFSYHRRK